jgi:uridine kinase
LAHWPDGDALAGQVALAMAERGDRAVILIDGPSGAGKSTLADALVAAWPGNVRPVLVRLDEIYPGWDGLEAASLAVTEDLLKPYRAGRAAGWRRFDWTTGRPAEWHDVDPVHPLVVEGCGSLSAANAFQSDVRVWVRADDAVRKYRALARDGATFADHWDQWQRQWTDWCLREDPQSWATLQLST